MNVLELEDNTRMISLSMTIKHGTAKLESSITGMDVSDDPMSLAKLVAALSLATERTASDGAAYGKDATLLLGMMFSSI